MSSPGSSFPVSHRRAAGRPDRLLRASVTAFCSITRPTRRETAQLDDLAAPLLGLVGDDTLRFVASALSESPHAPPLLVRRLADQPVEISAPLLMRSPVLTNIDLVALIGRHGLAHARAIGTRAGIDERLARLIRSLGALEAAATADPQATAQEETAPLAAAPAAAAGPGTAEETRERLRAMMRPSGRPADPRPRARAAQLRWEGDPGPYRKLLSTALTGVPALFHTALAGVLGIDVAQAHAIAAEPGASSLTVALRALSLSQEEAFLLIRCVHPAAPADPRSIAAFLDAYEAIAPQDAQETVASWRRPPQQRSGPWQDPANAPSGAVALKAS